MDRALDDQSLRTLFDDAHTAVTWSDTPVDEATIHALYDRLKYAPTSANCSPARFVFVRSMDAKEKLKPFLMEGNVEKVMTAPVTVIIGHDLNFAEQLPTLFPHNLDAKNWFADPAVAELTAFRNGTLQGAYLMMAARALGLDCGPMSGFDNAGVDDAFFQGTQIKSNFICALGVASPDSFFPRSPRLAFDDAAQIV